VSNFAQDDKVSWDFEGKRAMAKADPYGMTTKNGMTTRRNKQRQRRDEIRDFGRDGDFGS
jgi:hypothetical protein